MPQVFCCSSTRRRCFATDPSVDVLPSTSRTSNGRLSVLGTMPSRPNVTRGAGTLRLAILSVPSTPIAIRKIADAINRSSTMTDATMVDLSENLQLPEEALAYIHGKSVTDPGVQEIIVGSDRWPGMMEALISDSTVVTIRGCRVIIRTDCHSGVLSDSACRNEAAILNWLGGDDTRRSICPSL